MAEHRPAPSSAPRDSKVQAPTHVELPSTRCVLSEQLFGDAVEVQIDHRGVVYRLRQTALGKLILTK